MKKIGKFAQISICVLLVLAMVGCGSTSGTTPPASSEAAPASQAAVSSEAPAKSSGPVQIIYPTFRSGVHGEAASFAEMIAEFNRQHEGKYEVIIEEGVPDVMEFMNKLNMWYAAGDLPVIVDPLMQDKIFANKIFDDGICVDLAPYINGDTEWKNRLLPTSLEAQTRPDGKIFSLPVACYSAIGIFYNKTMFDQAGVTEFPKTWDDMFVALDKLQAINIPGFFLETTGTSWSPSLLLSALIARTEEGRAFMRTTVPDNYNIPAVVDALTDLQRLYEYAAADSVGGGGQMTTSAFVSSRVAMQPNGPWHLSNMYPETAPEGFAENVDIAVYPGGIMLDHDSTSYNVAVINTYPPEQIEAALAVCKFYSSDWYLHKMIRDRSAATPFATPNDEDMAQMTDVAIKYCNLIASGQIKEMVPQYQVVWDSLTVGETLDKYMPLLAQGQMTPDEMATEMTKSAQYFIENVG